jgi:hypothetical protein
MTGNEGRNKLAEPLILYSTISRLAYLIAKRYYNNVHYVWCAPVREADAFDTLNPPSSDPLSIYWSWLEDVVRNDDHSSKIADNRRGLILGATVKEGHGVIDEHTRGLIEGIVNRASISDFKPLFIAMPYQLVRNLLVVPSFASVASATSQEYIIEALPRTSFDIMELEKK